MVEALDGLLRMKQVGGFGERRITGQMRRMALLTGGG